MLAAKTRGFKAILDIEKTRKEGGVKEVYYHRKCRSSFTMKKSLKAIKQKKKKKVTIPLPHKRRTSVVSTPASRMYDPICIFCGKNCKYQKKKDTREPLTKCTQLRSDETIRQAAVAKMTAKYLLWFLETQLQLKGTTTGLVIENIQRVT